MGEIVPYTEKTESFEDLQHRCQPFVIRNTNWSTFANESSLFQKLEWIFGFNPRIPVVNLTSSREVKEMVMSSGNSMIFYKFENQVESIQTLVGHVSLFFAHAIKMQITACFRKVLSIR